jgi:hypothetical protein
VDIQWNYDIMRDAMQSVQDESTITDESACSEGRLAMKSSVTWPTPDLVPAYSEAYYAKGSTYGL